MDVNLFDAEELLHLAVNAMAQQKPMDALEALKHAAQLEPQNAKVAYFTGIVYTQTGLTERAIQAMQRAVQLDPALYLAHFQIGLMLFASDREEEARAAWQALDVLGTEHPLVLFKLGLQALGDEEYEQCRTYLSRGIERNTQNSPLNEEMRKFIRWSRDQEDDEASEGESISPLPVSALSQGSPLPAAFRRDRH